MALVTNAKNDNLDNGMWFEFSGSKFKIVHSSNLKFQRLFARLQQPHKAKILKDSLDPKISKDIVCKSFAEALIVDWSGVIDSEGNEVEFSVEAAYEALQNNPDLIEFVQITSNELSYFKDEELTSLGKS